MSEFTLCNCCPLASTCQCICPHTVATRLEAAIVITPQGSQSSGRGPGAAPVLDVRGCVPGPLKSRPRPRLSIAELRSQMSTLAVPSDMVALNRSSTLRSSEPFDQSKKWCWRNGSAGGEEWNRAVHEAAETHGLTEALLNEAPTLEQVVRASSGSV